MDIRTLVQKPLRTADPEETLADAADRMTFFEIGALAVFDHGALEGIITERDIVRAVADGHPVNAATVAEHMTRGPVAVSVEDDVDRAIAHMVFLGTRHLPVDDGGATIGMISARDLLAASMEVQEIPVGRDAGGLA